MYNSPKVKVVYMIFAVLVGIGAFFGLATALFNSGSGLLSTDNKPFAVFMVLITLLGVAAYVFLGKILFKSLEHTALTLGIITISCLLTFPGLLAGYELKESIHKFYAKHQTDTYVSQLRDQLLEDKSVFKLDYEQSNYDTIYYGDFNWLELEKLGDETLTTDDIDQLLFSLPTNDKGFQISIAFGKYEPKYERRASSIAIFLDQSKEPQQCDIGIYDENLPLCEKYNRK